MYKKMFFLLPIILFLYSCKKAESPQVAQIKYTATIDALKGVPGESVFIRFDQPVKKEILQISLNNTGVKAYLINDSLYSFIVPVISPGDYDITFQEIALQSKLNLSIGSYPVIPQPQIVIDSFSIAINNSIDSLMKLSNAAVAPINKEIIPFVKQLQEEWNTAYASLSADEKNQLAYFVREHKIDFTSLTSTALPAIYYKGLADKYRDPGEELIKVAKEFVVRKVIAVGTIPVLLTSLGIFIYAPNPYSAALVSASFLSYIITREAATKKVEEFSKLNGVVEAITDISSNAVNKVTQTIRTQSSGYTSTSTIPEFKPDIAQLVKMKVEFRNLIKTDIGIHDNISNAIKQDEEFVNEDKRVTNSFEKIKNLLKKVNLNWVIYSSKIPTAIIKKTAYVVPASSIAIKSVSDNRLAYIASEADSGINVKISSAVAENINFNLVVGYKSNLINKSLEKSFPAKYLGAIDTAAVLVSHGKWQAVSGTDIDSLPVNVLRTGYGSTVGNGAGGITKVCTHVLTSKYINSADIQFYDGIVKKGFLNQSESGERMEPLPDLPNCNSSPFVKVSYIDPDTFEWQYLPILKVIRIKVTTPNNNGLADTGAFIDLKIISFSRSKMELQFIDGINNAPPSAIRYTFN